MWRLSLVLLLFFSFSPADAAQQLRVRNEHDRNIQEFSVGDLTFGSISSSQEAGYQEITPGAYVIKGRFEGQGYVHLDGKITIPPGPDTKWTLVLRSNRKFQLIEEVPPMAEDPDAVVVVTTAKNRVRFVNRFDSPVDVVTIGTATHRNIAAGAASRYVVMRAGEYPVTGEVRGFGPGSISGTIDTSGSSNRRFSVVLDERGLVILEIDL